MLAGRRELCTGGRSHVILQGRSRLRKCSWTRLAQVYPQAMAKDIAAAMGVSVGLSSGRFKLAIGGCAKCSSSRIGEASHPGPRRVVRAPRDRAELRDVPRG